MKLLIIRFSSIGDIILTSPIINEIKEKYPDYKIDFLTLSNFKDSISENSKINNLILFDKNKYKGIFGIRKFVKEYLKENNYDLVIDLHSKMRSKLICFFLGEKYYRYKKRSWWKTLLVKLRLIKYQVDDTIVKNYFGAVKDLNINYKSENLDFFFSEGDLEKVKEYEKFVVFAPGASKETKKWPKEYFGRLAEIIRLNYKKEVILIGSKQEFEDLEYINKISNNSCINLAGKLSLKESGALISKADFILTNDSGPFHISRGVKTRSFVIFGPTSPGMFEFNKNETLIYANEECSPCSLHGDKECPKKHFNCMRNLSPEKVFEIIEKNK